MTDQNRKTLRSFYCRDYLWDLFEQMTHDLGCSMDYLINESMRLYARSRDYAPGEDGPQPGGGFGGPPQQGGGGFGGPPQQGGFGGGGGGAGGPGNPGGAGGGQPNNPLSGGFGGNAMEHRTFDRIPPVGQQQQQQQRGGFGGPPQSGSGGPPPPPPRPGGANNGGGFGGGSPQPGGGGGGGGGFGGGQNSWNQGGGSPQGGSGFGGGGRPQQGGGFNGGGAMASGQQPLYLLFNNNRYVIDKEKFVIGRGSQQTDLTIRDGNISRKHCAVLFRNGSYYIKDLDSTNGVEFRGNRIESKKVDEGDIFYLCDYELRFTYRP